MILVLGGTTEGRRLADYLHDRGFKITVSTATGFPNPRAKPGMAARSGPLSRRELAGFIEDGHIQAVIDATHPFAAKISKLARTTCDQAGLPYLRFERAAATIPNHPAVTQVNSQAEAAAAVAGRKVFLATGAQSIGQFITGAPQAQFFARVLPWPQSINEALKWLPADNIIAAVGPFTKEFNQACFRFFNAGMLVTKDSGAGAGVEDKLDAALELDMKVLVIRRPPAQSDSFTDFADVAAYLEGSLDSAI